MSSTIAGEDPITAFYRALDKKIELYADGDTMVVKQVQQQSQTKKVVY